MGMRTGMSFSVRNAADRVRELFSVSLVRLYHATVAFRQDDHVVSNYKLFAMAFCFVFYPLLLTGD